MLCCMHKIINGIPNYFTDLFPRSEIGYKIGLTKLFFLYTIEGWYSVDPTIINSKSLDVFKNKLLAFIRPVQPSIYSVFNPQGLTFLIRLRLRLSH